MRGDDLSGAVSVRTMHKYATNKKSQDRNTASLRKLFKMAQLCHKPSFLHTWKGTTGNVHIKNK